MLQYSSALYLTVVLHAFHARNALYHHVFLVVAYCSALFYAQPAVRSTSWLDLADAMCAHAGFVCVALDPRGVRHPWLLLFPAATAALWLGQRGRSRDTQDRLHVCLHVISVVGLHCYLMYPPLTSA